MFRCGEHPCLRWLAKNKKQQQVEPKGMLKTLMSFGG
jgi:hypothetical protein